MAGLSDRREPEVFGRPGGYLAATVTYYGFFSIYLAVHIALLGAEVNVVAAGRLWPRSPVGNP